MSDAAAGAAGSQRIRLRDTVLPLLDRFTDRRREAVALVAEGLSNAEVAQRLVISAATAFVELAEPGDMSNPRAPEGHRIAHASGV